MWQEFLHISFFHVNLKIGQENEVTWNDMFDVSIFLPDSLAGTCSFLRVLLCNLQHCAAKWRNMKRHD